MSNFDYFKQYQAEQKRIQDKIREEENPYHRQHIQEFSDMMDEKIRTHFPMYMQEYNEKQKVDVEAYFNGKPATDTNIVKGVQNMVEKALKKLGRRR